MGSKQNYDYLAAYLNSSGGLVSSFGVGGLQTHEIGPADEMLVSSVIISNTVYTVGRSQEFESL